jgi:hypothetical protein
MPSPSEDDPVAEEGDTTRRESELRILRLFRIIHLETGGRDGIHR